MFTLPIPNYGRQLRILKRQNGKLAISLISEMEMPFNAFPFHRYNKSQLDVKGL